jgi:hypothetical protein
VDWYVLLRKFTQCPFFVLKRAVLKNCSIFEHLAGCKISAMHVQCSIQIAQTGYQGAVIAASILSFEGSEASLLRSLQMVNCHAGWSFLYRGIFQTTPWSEYTGEAGAGFLACCQELFLKRESVRIPS